MLFYDHGPCPSSLILPGPRAGQATGDFCAPHERGRNDSDPVIEIRMRIIVKTIISDVIVTATMTVTWLSTSHVPETVLILSSYIVFSQTLGGGGH